ncbi:Exonuclease mut-7 homolog [Gryllus bimaculatus]|nr:Exonuclease mut-7 homolog [Gryllus bimaculatus]
MAFKTIRTRNISAHQAAKCVAGFKAIMEATKFSSKLPSGHSWDLYNAYPSFQKIMDCEGRRILEIMNMVLGHQGIRGNIAMRDIEEKYDLLVECNDTVLERVGYNLDELSGIRRNPEPLLIESTGNTTRVVSGGSWNRNISDSSKTNSVTKVPLRLLTAKNIERPQIKFKDKIDNSSNPFEPRIREKPNALKPLSILVELSETGECHPYEYELDLFKPPEDQLKKKYPDLDKTPLVMVNTPDDVQNLLNDLKKYREIAVDLEHHSYRSFQGITCLMQISTRDTDYVIDTLELRDKLYVLNEVFTDPKVVKVFHGALCDVEWLQRDLCLYVVNMFDTHLAARMLNFTHLSLAYLLKHYCNVAVNKQFQLADWRIRPLPNELVNYAREDTHYLLYVYDLMKNALIEGANGQTNLLLSVLEQSKEVCKRRYEKPLCTEDSHLDLYRKNKKMFDNRQMYAFRELYLWRDKTAREEDESTGYVLPNHMLMSIADVLPREMQGILALCSPIPPLVRQNLVKLHQIVLKAREQSLTRPVMEDEARMRPIAQVVWNKLDLDSPLYCPHDMKYRQDFREDLPTVLNPLGQSLINVQNSEQYHNPSPHITLFDSCSESEAESEECDTLDTQTRHLFVSPYERYKSARPFIEAQEREKQEALEAQARVAVEEADSGKPNKDLQQEVKEEPIGKRKRIKEEKDDNLAEASTPQNKSKQPRVDNSDKPLPPPKEKIHGKRDNPTDDSPGPSKKKKLSQKTQGAGAEIKTLSEKSTEESQAFDFSKVDYNKFQGGSTKESSKQSKNKGKFKPKGKKSKFVGKTNHKSFTFGSKGR